MPFEFMQIPANGQGSAKEGLNQLLRNGRIASMKKEFVSNGEDSFWAFCISPEQRDQLPRREPQQQHPDEPEQQHRVPYCPQLSPLASQHPPSLEAMAGRAERLPYFPNHKK